MHNEISIKIMTRHTDIASLPIPSSRFYDRGKFGRLFPWLPPCIKDEESSLDLLALADLMKGGRDDSRMPAGYTYLGQFIIHDISFDPTSINERQVDPDYLWNFRTPALDLDSLYGGGPFVTPFLYEATNQSIPFLMGNKWELENLPDRYKIPRTKAGIAIISDPRNDENAIISQLHATFLMLHNEMLKRVDGGNRMEKFFLARRETTWLYQWVILKDYLPRIVDKVLVEDILENGRKYYDWHNEPFIPLEFSAAAFRFGHAQVKPLYTFNNDNDNLAVSVFIEPKDAPRINWKSFFFLQEQGVRPNFNRQLGPFLTELLNDLPESVLNNPELPSEAPDEEPKRKNALWASILDCKMKVNEKHLAARNLFRGTMLKLPSGQGVARAMKKKGDNQIEVFDIPDIPEKLKSNTPLWYWILYEAQQKGMGEKLGPVGARIVAEVIIGLLEGDKTSFLNQDPNWIPRDKEGKPKEEFNMIDLLELAGVY